MHIAFTVPDLGGGGAETVVLNLAGELIRRGNRIDLVLLRADVQRRIPEGARLFVVANGMDGPSGAAGSEVSSEMIQVSSTLKPSDWMRVASALNWDPLCLPSVRLARQARALACYMEREKPDCVLPNIPRATLATLLARRFVRQPPPVVPVIHNLVRRHRHRWRQRHLAGETGHFISVSHGVSTNLAAAVGVPRDRIATIYNPVVTPDLYAKASESPTHPWLVDGSVPVVLAAGRLEDRKGFPTLLKAFGRLAARRPCHLIILGEGRRRKELEELVGELDLTDRVSLPGWVENPFALMSRAALFVLSSIHEGLPTVLVEAMACGCPCVSTDCPAGPAEILQDGRYGPLVPVGDESALAEAMGRVLDQPPDRHMLRQRAADFSVERAVDAYEQLIESLVSYEKCGTDGVR